MCEARWSSFGEALDDLHDRLVLDNGGPFFELNSDEHDRTIVLDGDTMVLLAVEHWIDGEGPDESVLHTVKWRQEVGESALPEFDQNPAVGFEVEGSDEIANYGVEIVSDLCDRVSIFDKVSTGHGDVWDCTVMVRLTAAP